MNKEQINVAVVTGGHAFNVPEFQHLFKCMTGITAYIQHLDDFACASEKQRDSYDVILLYIMMMEGPTDDLPGFRNKPKKALERLGSSPQGIVVMHHGLLAYPEWSMWNDLVAIDERKLQNYEHDVSLSIRVEPIQHPITNGISDWQMIDETYNLNDPNNSVEPLLSVAAPNSMKTIAWTHTFKQSRVFCLQLGHDEQAWQNNSFQKLLSQAIAWTCHKL